jgi:hypothetical protein
VWWVGGRWSVVGGRWWGLGASFGNLTRSEGLARSIVGCGVGRWSFVETSGPRVSVPYGLTVPRGARGGGPRARAMASKVLWWSDKGGIGRTNDL